MSGAQGTLAAGRSVAVEGRWQPPSRRRLHGSDLTVAIAFVAPYAVLFFAFAAYPIAYALWMGSRPSLYADLLADRLYLPSLINTLLFAGIGVNVKMFLALLLSGFFLHPSRWIKALLFVYLLPWMLPAVQACISFRWMLAGEDALVDRALEVLFGVEGPIWFNHWWLALCANIVAYGWKWMPFWTMVFLAGWPFPGTFPTRPPSTEPRGRAASSTSRSRSWRTSISFARYSPPSGRWASSPPCTSCRAARRCGPRKCWRRSPSTTPSTPPIRPSVWPR